MKHLITVGFLILACHSIAANKKRPSWSQGLPERTAAPTLNPSNISLKQAEFKIDRSTFKNEWEPEGVAITEVEKHTTSLAPTRHPSQGIESFVPITTEATKPSQTSESVDDRSAQLSPNQAAQPAFNWKPLRLIPVQVPQTILEQQNSVLLKIEINTLGEVIAVSPVVNDTNPAILIHAQRHIKRWRFEVPHHHGITNPISRVFKVDLVLAAT